MPDLTTAATHCKHRARGAGAGKSVAASPVQDKARDLQSTFGRGDAGSIRGEGGAAASGTTAAARAEHRNCDFGDAEAQGDKDDNGGFEVPQEHELLRGCRRRQC